MSNKQYKIVFCGLSITSSWGNGHATTYRGLIRELTQQGHKVLFLERDRPWYAENRDLPHLSYARVELYSSVEQFKECFTKELLEADAIIVGSFVPEGIEIGKWVHSHCKGISGFYDIDTPVTLSHLYDKEVKKDFDYLSAELIPLYDLYLSFTGGPTLKRIEKEFHSPQAVPLYCSVDTRIYFPENEKIQWDLGYLGTYSADRQASLEKLLIDPAIEWSSGRFIVAGAQYPDQITWPFNVNRVQHISPQYHSRFYSAQRFTLNLTRREMQMAGYSPSVRLFEAAATGVPIISDYWPGLECFFSPGKDILIAQTTDEILKILKNTTEEERQNISLGARQRIIKEHTARHRASQLIHYISEAFERKSKNNKKYWGIHGNHFKRLTSA